VQLNKDDPIIRRSMSGKEYSGCRKKATTISKGGSEKNSAIASQNTKKEDAWKREGLNRSREKAKQVEERNMTEGTGEK